MAANPETAIALDEDYDPNCPSCGHTDDHIDRRDGCVTCNGIDGPCAAAVPA